MITMTNNRGLIESMAGSGPEIHFFKKITQRKIDVTVEGLFGIPKKSIFSKTWPQQIEHLFESVPMTFPFPSIILMNSHYNSD